MGWASRANPTKYVKETKSLVDDMKRVKVHIPNSTLDLHDALFLGMTQGFRPMSNTERKEAEAQGMDLRAPDIIRREKELHERFDITKPKHEVQIILTDKD